VDGVGPIYQFIGPAGFSIKPLRQDERRQGLRDRHIGQRRQRGSSCEQIGGHGSPEGPERGIDAILVTVAGIFDLSIHLPGDSVQEGAGIVIAAEIIAR
jgi:hypothetical protein